MNKDTKWVVGGTVAAVAMTIINLKWAIFLAIMLVFINGYALYKNVDPSSKVIRILSIIISVLLIASVFTVLYTSIPPKDTIPPCSELKGECMGQCVSPFVPVKGDCGEDQYCCVDVGK